MLEASRALGVSSGDSYVLWEPPGHAIAILLNVQLIGRLRDALAPDSEAGGILLGRAEVSHSSDRRVVVVNDFIPFESEHIRGPAFSLSPNDKAKLKRLLRLHSGKPNAPVGFFRTHRRKGLYLDEADFSIAQEFFPGPTGVILLARPEPDDVPAAGFFFWEEGDINRQSTYRQFPLDTEKLRDAGYAVIQSPTEHVSREGRVAQRTVPRAPAGRTPSVHNNPRRLVYALLAAILLITPFVWWLASRAGDRGSIVSLSVQREGNALRLNWDPDAPAVRSSNSAIVWISDGGRERRMDIDARHLRAGHMVYVPESPDVTFRMDLVKVSPQGSESVQFVNEQPAATAVAQAPSQPAPPAQPPPQPAPQQPQALAADHSPRPKPQLDESRSVHAADEDSGEASRAAAARPAVPIQFPPPFSSKPANTPPPQSLHDQNTAPPPAAPPLQVQPPPEQERAAAHPRIEPSVTITTQPVEPAKMRQWVNKVPVFRMLQARQYKAGEDFSPPRAYKQVAPRVSPSLARDLPGDWRVDFKLKIDEGGRVQEIECLSPRADGRLVDLATDSMSRWKFEPARLRHRPVASEIYATVHFRNPPPDRVASSGSPQH